MEQILIELSLSSNHSTLFLGDLNVRVDAEEEADTRLFADFCEAFGLTNLINFSTHKAGHTLDLVLCDEQLKSHIVDVKEGPFLSDHKFVGFTFVTSCHKKVPKKSLMVKTCKLCDINKSEFSSFLKEKIDHLDDSLDLESMVDNYNTMLTQALDKFAPLKERKIRPAENCTWMSDRIREMIRIRSSKEHKWRLTQMEYHWYVFKEQQKYVKWLIKRSKQSFFAEKFNEIRYNAKEVFRLANRLLFREKCDGVPIVDDTHTQALEFNQFFIGKIDQIRLAIDGKVVDKTISKKHLESDFLTEHRFETFDSLSIDEVDALIRRSATKSCALDPCNTSLVKDHKEILLPFIRNIINVSLETGAMPSNMKTAKV